MRFTQCSREGRGARRYRRTRALVIRLRTCRWRRPAVARLSCMGSLRRMHERLGRNHPVTRFGVYASGAALLVLSLWLAAVLVRRGQQGLPLWSPQMTRFALGSFARTIILIPTALAYEWAARRREWWAHALAGAVAAPAWVFAMGLPGPHFEHAAIGAAVFVALGRLLYRQRAREASPARPVLYASPQLTEREFAEWSRSWQTALRGASRPVNAACAVVVVVVVALNVLVFPRFMSPGWAGVSMLLIILAAAIVAGRSITDRRSRVIRELGRACFACQSIVEDPRGVVQRGGQCVSCGSALYTPAT